MNLLRELITGAKAMPDSNNIVITDNCDEPLPPLADFKEIANVDDVKVASLAAALGDVLSSVEARFIHNEYLS